MSTSLRHGSRPILEGMRYIQRRLEGLRVVTVSMPG